MPRPSPARTTPRKESPANAGLFVSRRHHSKPSESVGDRQPLLAPPPVNVSDRAGRPGHFPQMVASSRLVCSLGCVKFRFVFSPLSLSVCIVRNRHPKKRVPKQPYFRFFGLPMNIGLSLVEKTLWGAPGADPGGLGACPQIARRASPLLRIVDDYPR